MQFNVVIERDEDGRYVVECLNLPLNSGWLNDSK